MMTCPKLVFSPNIRPKNEIKLTPGKKLTIGRSADSDVPFSENKLISSRHCELLFNDISGMTTLTDHSTNGTIINGIIKLTKAQKEVLNDGDIVYLVKKKSTTIDDISFTFHTQTNELKPGFTFEMNEVARESKTPKNKENFDDLNLTTISTEEFIEPVEKMPKLEHFFQNSSPKRDSPKLENFDSSIYRKWQEKMEEMLICSICCDIIHNAISLTPCCHKYCASCYSNWMRRSNECPECRVKVDLISKDHQLNGIAGLYLETNPDKKRPPEELARLNEMDKIYSETMIPPETSENISFHNDGQIESDVANDHLQNLDTFPVQRNRLLCQSCPGFLPNNPDFGLLSFGCLFKCGPEQNHLLCQCCLLALPDRRSISNLPSVQCELCSRFFCSQYWKNGCQGFQAAGCSTCLKKIKDYSFFDTDLDRILNGNQYESNAMKVSSGIITN